MNHGRLVFGAGGGPNFPQVYSCILLAAFVFGLAGCNAKPNMTFAPPKIYTDEYVVKAFSERRKAIRKIGQTVKAADLQEIAGVRQATRFDLNVTAQPANGGALSAPEPVSGGDVQLPENPSVPKGTIGRRHADILTDQITRDQNLTALELLYLGDSRVLKDNLKFALIRLDVSINDYSGSVSDQSDFVQADFRVTCHSPESEAGKNANVKEGVNRASLAKGDKAAEVPENANADATRPFDMSNICAVYHLSPEKSSVVAQESLASSSLRNYATQLGTIAQGADIRLASRLQKQLEETLLSVVDRPVQFAIYGERPSEFSFAFGPTRRIDKRHPMNPARWVGNAYVTGHEIQPGPRDVYALMVIPEDTKAITVEARAKPSDEDDDEEGRKIKYDRSFTYLISGRDNVKDKGNEGEDETKHRVIAAQNMVRKIAAGDRKIARIFPALTNTLYLPVEGISAESEVMVGHVRVPQSNVSLIDRNLLRVTIAPDKGLQALLSNDQTPNSVDVQVINPGRAIQKVFSVELAKSTAEVKPKPVVPSKGKAREQVAVKLDKIDPKQVTKVVFGGQKASFLVGKKQVVVTVPDLKHPVGTPKVAVWVYHKDTNQKTRVKHIPAAFTYVN